MIIIYIYVLLLLLLLLPTAQARRANLTRDQRKEVLVLRSIGWSYKKISDHCRISQRQVQKAYQQGHPTPQKSSGRPLVLSNEQVDELVLFIRASSYNRSLSYYALATGPFAYWEVTDHLIRRALLTRGYRRCKARIKPQISERTRQRRLEFARSYLHYTREQWARILWSDETWVNSTNHRANWVTRCASEEFEELCTIQKPRRYRGWIFWGSIHGCHKGPCVVWHPSWGSIISNSYRARIIPLIAEYFQLHPDLILMQDNAPSHSARATKEDISSRGIPVISWPANSPDLNPIESLWGRMKDYMIFRSSGDDIPYNQLQEAIQEAWNSIPESTIQSLIDSMPARLQAVIDANGGPTKW